MEFLTRKQIQTLGARCVEVKIGDSTARLKVMTGRGRSEFLSLIADMGEKEQLSKAVDVQAWLVSRTLVDADGMRLYGNSDTASLVDEMDSQTLGDLFEAALRLNGLHRKTGGDTAGNSTATQS